jgi:DNA repair exonuclease SbcCD ATPase subunit
VMLGQGGIFSKPFAECTDKERKDILEYLVLDPEKLKELSQVAKQERNDLSKEIDKIQNDIEVCEMLSAHLAEQLGKQKTDIKRWDKVQKKKIKQLQKKVDQFSEIRTVQEIKDELSELEEEMSHADKQSSRGSVLVHQVTNKITRESTRLISWRQKLKSKRKLIKDKNCPTCGQSTKALKKSFEMKILPSLVTAAENDIEDLESVKDIAKVFTNEFQSEVEDSRPIYINLEAEKEVAIDAAYQRSELEAALKEKNPYTDSTDSIRKKQKENRSKKKELKSSKKKKEVELRHWEFWVQAWSDRGIKALILESVLPLLEEYTNYYVSILADDKLTVSFDVDVKDAKEKFVVKAKNEDGADVYRGNSGGEKQRVDLAIYFALGSISALQQKETMRTMFVDCGRLGELDEEGLEDLVKLLETEVAKKYDTILIVSHMRRVEDLIGDPITIRKIKGVSEVYNG